MSVIAKPLINSKFASDSAESEYEAPSNTRTIVDKFTATNTHASAVTLTVYIVPSGGSAGASNTIIKAQSLAASETADLTELKNQILDAADTIDVVASVADKIVIRASGREIS